MEEKEEKKKLFKMEMEGKKKNVFSRTIGLIYFEGEFVSGMTIPFEIIGWMEKRKKKSEKPKDKETFWRIDSIFLSIFPLVPMDVCDLCFHDDGEDDAWSWVGDESGLMAK